jgi:hypothetical protein
MNKPWFENKNLYISKTIRGALRGVCFSDEACAKIQSLDVAGFRRCYLSEPAWRKQRASFLADAATNLASRHWHDMPTDDKHIGQQVAWLMQKAYRPVMLGDYAESAGNASALVVYVVQQTGKTELLDGWIETIQRAADIRDLRKLQDEVKVLIPAAVKRHGHQAFRQMATACEKGHGCLDAAHHIKWFYDHADQSALSEDDKTLSELCYKLRTYQIGESN